MGTPNIIELGRCAVVNSHLSSRYVMSITHKTLVGPCHIAFDTMAGLVGAMQIVALAMGKDTIITPVHMEHGLTLESVETTVTGFAYPF